MVADGATEGACTDVSVTNGTCATATPLVGTSGEEDGYLYLAGANLDPGCTTLGSAGNEVVFSISLTSGQTLSLTADTEADTVLYILDACDASECAAVEDEEIRDPEQLTFNAATAGTYYVVVDFYPLQTIDIPGGYYTLSWSVQ